MPFVAIVQSGAGTVHVAAAVTGRAIRLIGLWGSQPAAGTIQFKDTDATALSGPVDLAAKTPLVLPPIPHSGGYCETPAGKGLDLVCGTSGFNGIAEYVVAGT